MTQSKKDTGDHSGRKALNLLQEKAIRSSQKMSPSPEAEAFGYTSPHPPQPTVTYKVVVISKQTSRFANLKKDLRTLTTSTPGRLPHERTTTYAFLSS
ncbi:hypothetical protein Pcinc_041724 [Petrolisthes cinctipes]|uniref:Uncharacterized protein n=1 Tax=Petrolisthes cinctipes TaxID=88211 RepID=A0AAE1BM03_PETCI|nr:hypothetical protein Pcinc_041724 [Petrolisthes cinctipes]